MIYAQQIYMSLNEQNSSKQMFLVEHEYHVFQFGKRCAVDALKEDFRPRLETT